MTDLGAPERGAVTGAGVRPRPRAALPALCVTRITGWGVVHYAFPVLNPQITHGDRPAYRSNHRGVLRRDLAELRLRQIQLGRLPPAAMVGGMESAGARHTGQARRSSSAIAAAASRAGRPTPMRVAEAGPVQSP
ncbi:hypothetical protein SMICM304S_07595 [Streptomyces microflavus]